MPSTSPAFSPAFPGAPDLRADGFQPRRLRLARRFRGVGLQTLGASVGASGTLLSQVELGERRPSASLVRALGEVLGFAPVYFTTPVVEEAGADECSFRARASAPERLKKRVLAHATLYADVVRYLRTRVTLPPVAIPHVPPVARVMAADASDVVVSGSAAEAALAIALEAAERAAERCRMAWGLGLERPIRQVGRAVEHAGIVLAWLGAESATLDAFCRYGETPLILLNPAKGSTSRTRFDIAHELGHLVMHRAARPTDVLAEVQADRFASAFLMPRAGIAADLDIAHELTWPRILDLKRRWGASAAAVIRRAHDLGYVDAAEYRRLYRAYYAKRWHKGEPDEPAAEVPELVPRAFAVLADELGEDVRTTAAHLGWAPDTLGTVMGVEIPPPAAGPPAADGTPVISLEQYRAQRSADPLQAVR